VFYVLTMYLPLIGCSNFYSISKYNKLSIVFTYMTNSWFWNYSAIDNKKHDVFFGDKTSTYSYFFSFLTTLIGRKIRHYESVYFVFDQLTSVTPSIVVIKISFVTKIFQK
jgi:hypothetical protein